MKIQTRYKVPVIYEDDSILVVSKPTGLVSVPDGYDTESQDLVSVLEPAYGELWIVHRLDRETSGVIVLARTDKAHRSLSAQFEDRDVAKVYHAIVHGHPVWAERTIYAPLRPDADRYHRTVVDHEDGKPATTKFRVLEKFGHGAARYSLIEALPETGRTHQIRVHLMVLGSPVAVDALYGTTTPILLSTIKRNYRGDMDEEHALLERLGLHAFQLSIFHPKSGQEMHFEAPYPKDISATLKQLRKNAAL
jgi:RluA family pseudouridine synthase